LGNRAGDDHGIDGVRCSVVDNHGDAVGIGFVTNGEGHSGAMHVKVGGKIFRERAHPVRGDVAGVPVGAVETLVPDMNKAALLPLGDLCGEGGAADREKLGSMVKRGATDATSRQTPAWRSALVEHDDVSSAANEFTPGNQPGEAGPDDRNTHQISMP
jgi:hypothetical protein